MGERRRREIGQRGHRHALAGLSCAHVGKNLDREKDIELSEQLKSFRAKGVANIFRTGKLNVNLASTAGLRYFLQKCFVTLQTVGETPDSLEEIFRPACVVFRITPVTVLFAVLQYAAVWERAELARFPGPARLHRKSPRQLTRVDRRVPNAETDVVGVSGQFRC